MRTKEGQREYRARRTLRNAADVAMRAARRITADDCKALGVPAAFAEDLEAMRRAFADGDKGAARQAADRWAAASAHDFEPAAPDESERAEMDQLLTHVSRNRF